MGQGRSSRLSIRYFPWVFVVLLIAAYLVDKGNIFTELAAVLFIVVVPGIAIMRLLGRMNKLDVWERAILTIIIGPALLFIVFLSCQLVTDMNWIASTVLLLAPISCMLLLIGHIFEARVIVDIEGKDKNAIISEFMNMSKRERLIVIISIAVITVILMASFAILLIQDEEGFTEFYVLNKDGNAYDYPSSVALGNNTSIIVGIANREGRPVNYTVEIWLVNYTLINQVVNVTQMYFVDSFSVVLEHQDYDLNDPWSPQYEASVTISPGVAGDFQLFIMLFKDGTEAIPGPLPPDHTTDFSKTEVSWRLVMCVNNEINYLNLYLDVPA